ncbi:uncharacterized protein V6R79_004321 [Siganus canaliculatus]
MDSFGEPLPDSINPNNFPAKLWRLVNNPLANSIEWDSSGDSIIIDRRLFEKQILSVSTIPWDNPDSFKTTNFTSFVRQLNLYGFRKEHAGVKDGRCSGDSNGNYQLFYNPNFKRGHPELVASLKRLTVDNKAKLQAALDKSRCPHSQHKQFGGCGDPSDNKNVKRGSSSAPASVHRKSTHSRSSSKIPALAAYKAAYTGTPVPPRYLIRGQDGAFSPTVFAADKGISVSLPHHYTGISPGSSTVHTQQELHPPAHHGNPVFTTFNSPKAPSQCQPSCFSPVYQFYRPNLVSSHMTVPFSPQSYYQTRLPVNTLCHGNHILGLQHKGVPQEVSKCDTNLDTIFQLADEYMQTSANSCLVQIMNPGKPCCSVPCDDPLSATAVSGHADLVKQEEEEHSVLSLSDQLPDEVMNEVSFRKVDFLEVFSCFSSSRHLQYIIHDPHYTISWD